MGRWREADIEEGFTDESVLSWVFWLVCKPHEKKTGREGQGRAFQMEGTACLWLAR